MSKEIDAQIDKLSLAALRLNRERELPGWDANKEDIDEVVALQSLNIYGRLYAKGDSKNVIDKDKAPVDTDLLIDWTEYDEGKDPADVPNEEKTFVYYRKNADGKRICEVKGFEDLLEEQEPQGEVYAEPEKPKLGFFGWLRHKLSFFFGEPQEYKEYNRRKEAIHEKKKAMIREKYGYDKMKINEDLLDEDKVKNYIRTGDAVPTQQPNKSVKSNEIRESVISEVDAPQQVKEETNEKSDEKLIFEFPDEVPEQPKEEKIEQPKENIEQPKEENIEQPEKNEKPKMDVKKTKEEAAREMLKSYAQDDSKLRRFGAALLLAVIEIGDEKSQERQFLIDAVGGQKIRIDANRKKLENLEQNKDKMQPEEYKKQKDAFEKQNEKSAFAVNELVDYANRAYPEEEPKDVVAWTTGWLNKAMTNKVKTDLYVLHQKELADRKLGEPVQEVPQLVNNKN